LGILVRLIDISVEANMAPEELTELVKKFAIEYPNVPQNVILHIVSWIDDKHYSNFGGGFPIQLACKMCMLYEDGRNRGIIEHIWETENS
jgi:hypothetical protein